MLPRLHTVIGSMSLTFGSFSVNNWDLMFRFIADRSVISLAFLSAVHLQWSVQHGTWMYLGMQVIRMISAPGPAVMMGDRILIRLRLESLLLGRYSQTFLDVELPIKQTSLWQCECSVLIQAEIG